MCGIAGLINYRHPTPIDPMALRRMNGALTHRGPDDAGEFISKNVGIAMRRLSIVDVAGGHQPIANEDGSIYVVFNGEIYDHRILRLHLENRGHRFRTSSDTEVIVHAYEEFGLAFTEHLHGMFAVAIADLRDASHKLVLARDSWGKKPLYYCDADGTLRFASELKALVQPGKAGLDREALSHYLSTLFVPAPWTIFEGVRKLEPGTVLVVEQNGLSRRKLTLPSGWIRTRRVTRDDVQETRRLLLCAVEKRLTTEVPFGAFLSGGLDSGCVVTVMSRLLGERIATYSVGFEGPATHDETPSARATAAHLGTDHHEIRARPEILDLVPELVSVTDEPFAISSCLPLLELARAAARDVKVVLTGDGGDEVFGGYAQYRYERWAQLWRRLPRTLDPAASRLGGGRGDRFVAAARAESAGERRFRWASAFLDDEKPELLVDFDPRFRSDAWLTRRVEAPLDPEQRANAMDLDVFLPDEMLCKVDRVTMSASLEARSPLLDDALAKHVLGLDLRQRVGIAGGFKRLLAAVVQEWLPPHLLRRRKWGFNVPLDDWFRTRARAQVETLLAPSRISRHSIVRPDAVGAILQAHFDGRLNAANRIFALIVLHAWADQWLS